MSSFPRILCCAALLGLAAAPALHAQGEDKKSRAEERREQKEARAAERQQAKAAAKAAKAGGDLSKGNFEKEIPAIREAAALLEGVNDEEAAKAAARAIRNDFISLKVILLGTEEELENLAREQDKLNRQMVRLQKQPWFVSSGLQECWTLITDPFSRRSAQNAK